jgi:uncharacterized protein (DUF952 family)
LLIFHIVTRAEWQVAVERGLYEPSSLMTEGFIHCSTLDQVVDTANRFFRGGQELMLLSINAERVTAPVRFERPIDASDALRDVLFPHIYGALNLNAVTQTVDFEADDKHEFRLPEGRPIGLS